ncbi:SOUL family heme-binding protein [Arthrobacter sp. FW306-07-I]|uniref:SOUL family heme-binding protein n=1 Tax=Arthrobacter sp. FW306-07-I TaxID=2879622 RepID=UPI001F30708B|nr:heme-binding protein [Arthrobacter sp. FW306-07-I]UKA76377.1 heme-binding protein [Arthrobacter sp. FW306-07-I]
MTEQQPYELVRRYPHFELRRYPDYVVAEVTVTASFDRAGNAAFRYLFNYISGNNTARQKLAMTAPVLQEPRLGPQKLAMTAPVLQEPRLGPQKLAMTAPVLQSGPLPGSGQPAEFTVAFVLPAGVTAETAPAPTDPKVRVRGVPGSLAAVVGFSGGGSDSAFEKRNKGLQAALTLAGLTPVGPPRFARFDPPFKPWFLRHNEVVQDVREAGADSS